jgi:pyruvate-ferredoxin/flavodoxin oxidoreductase
VAKFASRGKAVGKKDLALMAMSYGYVYVARVAFGANDQHTLKAFLEAEAYDGPSLILAYSHCINQGFDLRKGLDQQRLAVQSGSWPLLRYNPDLALAGKNPLVLDSKDPTIPLDQYAYNETRFRMLLQSDEARAELLMGLAKKSIAQRWAFYQQMAAMHMAGGEAEPKA